MAISSWIKPRKRLIILASLDLLIILAASLNLIEGSFKFQIPIIFLSVVILFWLILSYTLGRYYKKKILFFRDFATLFTRNFLLILITYLFFYCLILFFNKISMFSISQSNFHKFYLSLIFGSFISQNLLILVLPNKLKSLNKWIFIGSQHNFQNLKSIIKRCHKKIDVINIDSYSPDLNLSGLIYEDSKDISENLKKETSPINKFENLEVFKLSDWCDYYLQCLPPEFLSKEDAFLRNLEISRSTIQLRIKRLGDFFFSIVLLFLALPLFLISFIAIIVEDGFDLFYSQIRVGKDSKNFRILKLRTMKSNAEKNGAQWARKNDERITKVGKYLRKTRIDELPQLISVLKGEMSLIGPRPERPEFVNKLNKEIPYYSLRALMRPGLSGWAQVNYPYGASLEDAYAKLSYDIYYQKNYSIWIDFLIFFKTIKLVLNAQGSTPNE